MHIERLVLKMRIIEEFARLRLNEETVMNELLGFLLCFCLLIARSCGGTPVPFVRQPFSDAGYFITRDFSGVHGLKIHESSRPFYDTALLDLLNSRVGVYEGDVSTVKCGEWEGARALILKIDNNANVEMSKIMRDGRRCPLSNAEDGILSDTAMFLGPKGNGLLFLYGAFADSINVLFSPNGLQIPIRFLRVGDLPKAKKLPSAKVKQFCDCRFFPGTQIELLPSGTYEALGPSAKRYGFEKQYLVCTKGKAHTVFFKGSNYWYDVNFERTDMNGIVGPFGRYSFGERQLKFFKVPVGQDDIGMLTLAVKRALGGETNEIAKLEARLLRMNQTRQAAREGYTYDNSKDLSLVFVRCAPLPMNPGNTRICACDHDITTTEKVLYYLGLLNGH